MTRKAHSRFPVRALADGRTMINLGSSARVAPGWNNVDFSWLLRLARYPRLCGLLRRMGLLSQSRYDRIRKLNESPGCILWDLSKGIPFADQTFDVVYHCHILEHIDRDGAPRFIRECLRVLKSGGILRVVVPDLERLARRYVEVMNQTNVNRQEHDRTTDDLFDQMIVRTPRHREQQNWIVRWAETLLVGDTAKAGILHRWMYDRCSLGFLLQQAGFVNVAIHTHATSAVAGWNDFHLDGEMDGTVYKPDSLYREGQRP